MLNLPTMRLIRLLVGINFGLVNIATAQNSTTFPTTLPTSSATTQSASLGSEYTLSGRWLYCVTRSQGKDTQTDLVISSIDGSQSKVLYSVRGRIFAINASFHPRFVTFTAATSNAYPTAYLLDLQTTHIKVLTPYRANNLGASVSPDGKQFLFSSDMDGNLEIYQNKLNDGENTKIDSQLRRLTNEPNADISPSWSPDGQSFIFISDRQAYLYPQVYRYDFATGQIAWIDTHSDYATEAKFNSTGDKITLLNRSQGAIFDLHTGQKKSVNNAGLDEAPTFSPDGKFVAYTTGNTIVVVPEHRIWEKQKLEDSDKILITPTLPKGIIGTIRRLTWIF